MKRFWTRTGITERPGGFAVLLDGRDVKLPGRRPLIVPFRPLAAALAAEWQQAGDNFTPEDLPLTRLAATAQDRVRQHHAEIVDQICAYGMNDLLCYRAADSPELAARENASWEPWLAWAETRFGARLAAGAGITPVAQPAETAANFKSHLAAMSEYQLAGLGVIVPALGSLILGLAVEAGALAPQPACDIAHLDELWQESRWGADAAAIARRQLVVEDVAVSARFMILCRP